MFEKNCVIGCRRTRKGGTRAAVDRGESDMVSKCMPFFENISALVVEEKIDSDGNGSSPTGRV